jgi:protein-tyrosine-phosphatase
VNEGPYNVLFLCTGNSVRSILAEVLIEHWGKERFKGYSAGSFPKGAVHPVALDLLERVHLPTCRLRSKSWHEFARPGAPVMDLSSQSATRPPARRGIWRPWRLSAWHPTA